MGYAYEIDHPGEYIREELEARGWSQLDLAYILGRPVGSINPIISGKRGITADMAKALGKAFDVPAEFFMNLQRMYDLSRADEPNPGIERRAVFFRSEYPVREMIKRGWLEDTDADLLETQMMRFFYVSSVDNIPHIAHAAKKTRYDDVPTSQLAWLFRVRHIAQSLEVPKYSEDKLRQATARLKALMSETEEIIHVPRILMECGIRFVLAETLPQAKIDGVCFWLNSTSPVIGMSLRFDRVDHFWFVLWHEIAHVRLRHGQGRGKEIIDVIEMESKAAPSDHMSEEEGLANTSAANDCVPLDKMDSFIARKAPYFSEQSVVGFAKIMHVHPGIVVGQLHSRTKNYRYFRKFLVGIREHIAPSAVVDGWGQIAPVDL